MKESTITALCCVCKAEIECTLEELLDNDDVFCIECAEEGYKWCVDNRVKPN
jgi:hypothetical protein